MGNSCDTAAGNLLGDGTTTYSYDPLNRLTAATAGSQQRSYSYNGDGVLAAQTANGSTTRFMQDLVYNVVSGAPAKSSPTGRGSEGRQSKVTVSPAWTIRGAL